MGSDYNGEKNGEQKHVAIYARISVKHKWEKEQSIENQICLAREYLKIHAVKGRVVIYSDQGYSGTNFNRPGFQRMRKEVENGKVGCIICKDFSRLGRNLLATGELVDKELPQRGVRLICISENYDSSVKMPGSLENGIRNLMNEWYAKDIGKKVHMAKQIQKEQGNYLGSRPPYGYDITVKNGRRGLERHIETYKIIEKIVEWAQEEQSVSQIRDRLFALNINPPMQYERTKQVYFTQGEGHKWDRSTLYKIIKHQGGLPHD